MNLFNPFPVVGADFRRNRLLVWVTVLLVALSVATGIAVISQDRALRPGSRPLRSADWCAGQQHTTGADLGVSAPAVHPAA